MTSIEPKTFFTALAFVTVMQEGRVIANDRERAEQIHELANLIAAFCAEAVPGLGTILPDDADSAAIDRMIEHHVHQLKEKEETRLPTDRATLIKLHDRLNYRNLRRLNRELYPTLSTAKLADFVLSYLDEEIKHSGDGESA